MSQINENEFHLDQGFMYGVPSKTSNISGDPRIGYTTLPRRCCLMNLIKRLNDLILDVKGAVKIKGTLYTWALTKDVAALTIDLPPNHPFRKFGLDYIQIYPSHKNLCECQGHYAYHLKDDSGVCQAIDSHVLQSLYSVVGRPVPDMGTCRSSCRSSGTRLGVPLRSHSDRSLHTRMEVRHTETLRRKIRMEIKRRQQRRQTQSVEIIPQEAGCPFYIHTTEVINNFMFASTQTLARLFQEIISLAPEGHLGIDHQKFLVQIFQLQKVAHSSVLLSKFKYLYNSVIRMNEGVEREEMGWGVKETIQLYGYGYIKHGLIDWIELNFTNPHVAERFPHPSHALSNITARPDDRRRLNDLFAEIDFMIGRLRMELDEEKREILLDWLVMRIIKQFLIDVTIYMIEGPYKFKNKEQYGKIMRQEDDDEDENRNSDRIDEQRLDNNRRDSIHRRRTRGTEETDTDYEWQSSESEVEHSLDYPKLIDVI
jgi:hypothetical protein